MLIWRVPSKQVREDWQVSVCDCRRPPGHCGAGGMRPEQGAQPLQCLTEGASSCFLSQLGSPQTRVGTAEQGLNSGQELWFHTSSAWYQSRWDWVSISGNSDPRLPLWGFWVSLGVRSQVVWSLS